MAVLQGQDGVLRLSDHGSSSTTYHLQVLFAEMDFSGPIARPKSEETMIMDRGLFTSNAHMINGNDDPRYGPVDISFTCRVADTTNSQYLMYWLSGVTSISAASTIYSTKGTTAIDGNTLPDFGDDSKIALRAEIIWINESGTTFGMRYNEVYFPPGEQTISEGADTLTLAASGKVYGDVSHITDFMANTTNFA